jgi:hypothetical protein
MSLERITNALNQGGAHLGDIVYWTLAQARIDRSTLESIWTAAQLAPEFLSEPPTAEKAFKTAAREAALGRPDLSLATMGTGRESWTISPRAGTGAVHPGGLTRAAAARAVAAAGSVEEHAVGRRGDGV